MQNCPTCQSDQFKKATLIYDENRSDTKSALAIKCAPPKLKEASPFGHVSMWKVLLALMPPFIAYKLADSLEKTGFIWILWGCIGLAFLLWKSWGAFKEHQLKQARALTEYEKCYMCLRCGALVQPFE